MIWYSYDEEQGPNGRYNLDCSLDEADDEVPDNFWSEHDGWEAQWPATFYVYESEGGPPVLKLTVEMEAAPEFYSSAERLTKGEEDA